MKSFNNATFVFSILLFAVWMLIIFGWMKDYEVKIDKLEAKQVCIETHPYSNKEWIQQICGKVVKND